MLMQSAERLFHDTGRELTGYEDGSENPKDDAAVKAAISKQPGIAGSSFVAVQQWQHDFACLMRRFKSGPAA